MFRHIAEVLTLILSVPGVILSMMVLYHWYKPAMYNVIGKLKSNNSESWFMVGVVVAFAGAVPDNIWWGIFWTLRSMADPNQAWWQANGIFINIPFRQGALFVAAYCHLRAAYIVKGQDTDALNIIAASATTIGIIAALVLHYASH